MESLRMESLYPDVFKAGIAFFPNCWDKSEHSLLKKIQFDEIGNAKKLDVLIFYSEGEGERDYHSDARYLRWMGKILSTKWIEVPNHNSPNKKELVLGDVECKIRNRMHGGWELKHNADLSHKKKAFTVVDHEYKKAKEKKARIHNVLQAKNMCFKHYFLEITDFIASRL